MAVDCMQLFPHTPRNAQQRNPLALSICVLLATAMDPTQATDAPVSEQTTQQTAEPASEQASEVAYEFDTSFLSGSAAEGVDVERFAYANTAMPGRHHVGLWLNGEWKGTELIEFRPVEGQRSAEPCYDSAILLQLGLDTAKLAEATGLAEPLPAGELCGDPGRYIPGATVRFDASEARLDFTVPQAYISRAARGYVDPALWDDGINAALLRYTFNTHHRESREGSGRSAFLGLNMGVNLGAWRLRHTGSMTWDGKRGNYRSGHAYAQRDLRGLKSQLVLGDAFTDGALFDSYRLLGARLHSDDRMLPDSQTGYAPVIRGVAHTNAKVTVRQRDYVVYETTVAPGPFEIDDLYATGYSGDLTVVVTEADGSETQFVVPFTAVPQQLRPGHSRYSIDAGKLAEPDVDGVWVMQGTYQRGLSNRMTGYAGMVLAPGYQGALAGVAASTPVGGVAFDVTRSRAMLRREGMREGYSMRLTYNKSIVRSNTHVALAAYRYSTEGYLNLRDAVQARKAAEEGHFALTRPRARFDLTVNQNLGAGRGSLYVAGSTTRFWDSAATQTGFSAGYNNAWRQLSYGISAQRTRDVATDRTDTQFNLNVGVPLGASPRAPRLSASHSQRRSGSAQQLNLYGNSGVQGQLSYGANLSLGNDGERSVGINAGYRGARSNLTASYTHAGDARQFALGASGSVVAHGGGVTLSQDVGDTIGIVSVPGGAGAGLFNSPGVKVDRRGFALVPYLAPYRLNTVEIDPKGSSMDVELKETTQRVAPTHGAVVMLKYATQHGRSLLLEATLENGEDVPFGADVLDAAGARVGVVGQGGRIFVRVQDEQPHGELTLRWGVANECRIAYARDSAEQETDWQIAVRTTCAAPLAPSPSTTEAAVSRAH